MQTKNEQAGNEAILDDAAGQAYVEQFAQETFERAMKPLRADKVTQYEASLKQIQFRRLRDCAGKKLTETNSQTNSQYL